MNEQSPQATDDRPTWTWWVKAKLASKDDEDRYYATAPHRAGAKQHVVERAADAGTEVEWLGEATIPTPTFDCPECNVHEAAMKLPNCREDYDWECTHCFAKFWGHPYDAETVRA